MKSVSFSEMVYASDMTQRLPQGRRQWGFWLWFGAGLLGIVVLMRLFDPSAPFAYIVLPVLAGAVLPVAALMPARFEAMTRFEARHLVDTVDHALRSLGYEQIAAQPDGLLYRSRSARWMRWPRKEVAIAVRPHVLDIAGPAMTLRALQKALAP